VNNTLVRELGKRLLLTIIISFLVNRFLGFDFAYFFAWTLAFLNIPAIMQNNNIKYGLRLLMALLIGIIGTGIIFSVYGRGRPFATYCIVLAAIYITSIVVTYSKNKRTS